MDCGPVWGTNYLEFEWFVPKVGPHSIRVDPRFEDKPLGIRLDIFVVFHTSDRSRLMVGYLDPNLPL